MNPNFSETVDILGTTYSILVKTRDEDPELKRMGVNGYCDQMLKRIVIWDRLKAKDERSDDNKACVIGWMKKTLRHEIVHAFLTESGLNHNTYKNHDSWAKNEEMVDWMAMQGPKLYDAWLKSGSLEWGMIDDSVKDKIKKFAVYYHGAKVRDLTEEEEKNGIVIMKDGEYLKEVLVKT